MAARAASPDSSDANLSDSGGALPAQPAPIAGVLGASRLKTKKKVDYGAFAATMTPGNFDDEFDKSKGCFGLKQP